MSGKFKRQRQLISARWWRKDDKKCSSYFYKFGTHLSCLAEPVREKEGEHYSEHIAVIRIYMG